MIRIAAIAAACLAIWLAWPAQDHTPPAGAPDQSGQAFPAQAQGNRPAGIREFFPPPPAALPALPPPPAQISAADSLAATRQHGDPQAPPIGVADAPRDMPTPAELADPKAYQAYEARQQTRVYASYVKAVDTELPILRDDIARGRSLGIDPEKIAKAENKVRRLEQMRADLLKQHPELGR